jgi:hypothetical protein
VEGLLNHALPALSTGYLNWTGSAWAFSAAGSPTTLTGPVTGTGTGTIATTITPGTVGQILFTNATPAAAWETVSQDASVSGTGAWTNSGLGAGTILITANAGTAQWWNGATPLLDQASTSGATGANFTRQSQASTATNGTPGNIVDNLPAPTGTGANAYYQLTQSGNSPAQLVQMGYGTGVTAGCVGLWLTAGSAPTGANATLFTFAGKTYVNNTVAIEMAISGTALHRFDSNGASFNSNATSATGVGIVLLGAASTNPSSITSPTFTVYYDNTVNNALLAIGPSANATIYEGIIPLWSGTQNTQAGLIRPFGAVLRTENGTATMILTIPLATSNTSMLVEISSVGRNVTAFAGGSNTMHVHVLNTAGTLSQTTTTVSTFGTLLATVTISGTNLLVQVTGVAGDNVDWTVEAKARYS